MFEDSLLIIKSDYMHKRKPVLLKLLQKEFQIQGNRRLRFTPELAAEFYKGEDESKSFMLLVIMLSKGNSEAFILTKENGVEELMNTMVCYFGSSVEMERNVHVSRTTEEARREITFIFPNYIHEPIPPFFRAKFINNPLSTEVLSEVFDIISGATGYPQNWKAKLAEWLSRSNATLPIISNQCSKKPHVHREEQSTWATQLPDQPLEPCMPALEIETTPSGPLLSLSSAGSSMMMTSSSCITCSCFDGEDTCYKPPEKEDSFELFIKRKTTKQGSSTSVSEEHVCEDQGIEWVEIIEDESQEGEEEAEIPSDQRHDAEKIPEETAEGHSNGGSNRSTIDERKSSIAPPNVEQMRKGGEPTPPQREPTPPPREPTPPPREPTPPPREPTPPPTEAPPPPPLAEEPPPPSETEPPPQAETAPPPPEEAPPPLEEAPH